MEFHKYLYLYHGILQTLNSALENLPKDRNGKMSKEFLRVALDVVAPSAGLPPVGAIEEVCNVVNTYCQFQLQLILNYFGFIYSIVYRCFQGWP